MKAILLVRIFISIFCYQTVYATSDSLLRALRTRTSTFFLRLVCESILPLNIEGAIGIYIFCCVRL